MAQSKAKKKLGGARIGGDGPREAKAAAVAEVSEKVKAASSVVLTEYRGMTVPELAELRAGLREAGAEYKIYKNRLAKIAVSEAGLAELNEHLEGPTAFAFGSGDPVDLAKALSEFAKKVQTLVLKAGVLDGRVLTPDQVKELAALDSREVMLTKLAGMLQAPLTRTASMFAAGFQQLGSMLAQLRDRMPAEEAAAPEQATPETTADAAPEATADAAPETPAEGGDAPATEEAPADGSAEQASDDDPAEG